MATLESPRLAGQSSGRELREDVPTLPRVFKPEQIAVRDTRPVSRRVDPAEMLFRDMTEMVRRMNRRVARGTGKAGPETAQPGATTSAGVEPLRARMVAMYEGEVLEVGECALIRLRLPDGEHDEEIPVSRLEAGGADFVGALIEYRVFEVGSIVASHIVLTGPPANEIARSLDWRLTSGLPTFAEDDEG